MVISIMKSVDGSVTLRGLGFSSVCLSSLGYPYSMPLLHFVLVDT